MQTKFKRLKLAPSSFAIALALVPSLTHAAVVVAGDPTTGTGTLSITEDITFTVTDTGNVRFLVFDEWATTDGGLDQASLSPSTLTYTINDGTPHTAVNPELHDNFNSSLGDLGPNDGFIDWFSDPSVIAGDTLTVKVQSWTIPATAGFNPGTDGIFYGEMFIADGSGNQISGSVPAPEPSHALLSLMGLAFLGFRRGRR